MPIPICFRWLAQVIRLARSFARDKAGNSIAARMAMMAITTSSSINVKPRADGRFLLEEMFFMGLSPDDLRVRLPFIECEALWSALVAVNELGVVQTHQIQNRRVEIMHVEPVLDSVQSQFVGFANDLSAF